MTASGAIVEFLSRLLEDEIERRAQKQLALRLRRAALNTTKTLEGFDFSFNPSLNRQQVLAVGERRLHPAQTECVDLRPDWSREVTFGPGVGA